MVPGLVGAVRRAGVVMKALNQRHHWHSRARWLVLCDYLQGVDTVQLEQEKNL